VEGWALGRGEIAVWKIPGRPKGHGYCFGGDSEISSALHLYAMLRSILIDRGARIGSGYPRPMSSCSGLGLSSILYSNSRVLVSPVGLGQAALDGSAGTKREGARSY
jgi:hypothetical protein